jgi:hypothetical protein
VVYENKKREMDAAKKQQTDDKPKEETPTNGRKFSEGLFITCMLCIFNHLK